MPRHSPRPASARDGRHRPLDLPATGEAVVQVWAARTTGLRGLLAVHCWLLLKPGGHAPFERWDVVGRRARTGRIGLQRNVRPPREGWGRREPSLVLDLRGQAAAAALPAVAAAIASYPDRNRYRAWPGPNCNSFVAHLARSVPAMRMALPPLAIGKDWPTGGGCFARAPSGTGWQPVVPWPRRGAGCRGGRCRAQPGRARLRLASASGRPPATRPGRPAAALAAP